MLTPWYFCSCIDAQPERAATFLDILDTLDDPAAPDQLRRLAVDELTRTSVWMQIFSLSRVIELCDENTPDVIAHGSWNYIEGVLGFVRDDVRRELEKLLHAAMAGRDGARDIQVLSRALDAVSTLSTREPSERPYIDLRDFLPQTLVLVALESFSRRDPRFTDRCGAELPSDGAALAAFYESALLRRYGRLCFCLALRQFHSFGAFAEDDDASAYLLPDQVRARTVRGARDEDVTPDARLPEIHPTLEPDLMDVYAHLELVSGSTGPQVETVQALIAESQLLAKLRELIPDRHRNARWCQAMRTLQRLDKRPEREEMSVSLWQCTLWAMAVKIDVVAASEALAAIWAPDPCSDQRTIEISGPVPEMDVDSWREQLKSLAKLPGRDDRKGVRLMVNRGQELATTPGTAALLFSPWVSSHRARPARYRHVFKLAGNRRGVERDDHEQVRYPGARTSYVALLRLLACSGLSVRCLGATGVSVGARREHASLVAHSADVLRQYDWLSNYPETQSDLPATRVPRKLIGLALHVRRSLHLTGEGHRPAVGPERFLDIASDDASGSDGRVSRERLFLKHHALPQLLVDWVSNAYGDAADGAGSSRWLKHAADVARSAREASGRPHALASILLRFLEGRALDEDEFDWRDDLTKKVGEQQKLYSRNLLMTPQLPASEWTRNEWREGDLTERYRLLRAAERVAVIDASVDEETRLRWTREFDEQLGTIAERLHADRYFRLRLIELMEHAFLKELPDVQIHMALVVLEFGSLYDQAQLVKTLFPVDAESWFTSNAARFEVRTTLLQAIVLKVRALEESDDKARLAESPHERLRELRRRRVLLKALRRAALACARTSSAEVRSLRKLVGRALRGRRTERRVGELELTASVHTRGDRDWLTLPGIDGGMAPAMAQSIIVDPNRRVAQLTVRDFDLDQCDLNLFTMERDELARFKDAPVWVEAAGRDAVSVPAVVVERQDHPEGKLVFHCGLPWHRIADRSQGESLRAGDWVRLPLRAVPSDGGHVRWQIPGKEPIHRLRLRVREGSFSILHIEERRNTRRGRRVALRRSKRDLDSKEWRLTEWDADLSRCFGEGGPSRHLSARYLDGRWQPTDGCLEELLLYGLLGDGECMSILCLLGTAELKEGSFGYRFSTAPGKNFVLEPADFDDESWVALSDKVTEIEGRRRDAAGLLVVVKVALSEGDVKLRLCQSVAEGKAATRRYPDLLAPFDLRNLRWRDFFDDMDSSPEATWEDGRWWVVLKPSEQVSSFPSRVGVELSRRQAGEGSIEIEVNRWSPRGAFVNADPVVTDRLKLGSSPESVLSQWFGLDRLSRVRLERAIGRVRDDGHVSCLTTHGFVVSCEAESLSMEWLASQERIDLQGGREAVVEWIRRSAASGRPAIDPGELPQAVQDAGEGQAVFSRIPRRGQETGTLCEVYWMDQGGGTTKASLHVQNFATLKGIRAGTLLKVQRDGDGWCTSLLRQIVRVRALWEQADDVEGALSGKALGVTVHDDSRWLIVEVSAGRFVLLDPPGHFVNHLADLVPPNGTRDGLNRAWCGNDIEGQRPWKEGRKRYRRCLLRERGRGQLVLPGVCRADDPWHDVGIARVRIELRRAADGTFTLRRLLQLEARGTARQVASSLKDAALEEAYRKELDDAISDGTEITGTVRAQFFQQRIPVPDDGGGWTNRVPIAADAGAYVATADYPSGGAAVLFRDPSQRILASMRLVQPLDVEQYREELEASYEETIKLHAPLYYVGRETEESDDGDEVHHHRLEWGYGLTLQVKESQLQFNGEPFSASEPVVYHGDAVLSVRFLRCEGANEVDGGTLLAIDELGIRTAQSTTIFLQRRRFRMVHLLQLALDGERLAVRRVAGFDQRRDVERRWFDRIDARMAEDSEDWLKERLRREGGTASERLLVLGRLNEDAYVESLGKTVVFQHVRFSFEPSDAGAALENGEIVFLQMDAIERRRNDVGLRLRLPDSLSPEDKGDDLRNLLVMRRSFSPRAGLLPRILNSDGSEALKDKYVLARLQQRNDGQHSALLLHSKLPRRTADAVASAIQAQQSPLFCAVLDVFSSEMDIELRPGILARLPIREIESVPDDLRPGAVICVQTREASPARFRVTRASFSESRYLDRLPRDVVALPMNPLLKADAAASPRFKSPDYWFETPLFTIGGLPELTAKAATFDPRDHTVAPPDVTQLMELMRRPHPKVAKAVLDEAGRAFVLTSPPPKAGCLKVEATTLAVLWVPLGNQNQIPLRWTDVTFADEPAASVMRRLERRWGYHDHATAHWRNGQVTGERVGPSSGLDGPLFFDSNGRYPTLRYPYNRILRYAFPVEELIDYLSLRDEGRARLPVAGYSRDGGLLLEVAPGRVVEAPSQRIVWRSRYSERSLRMQWESFAAGDVVELELVRGDVFAVDRLTLVDWLPGPRRALGADGAWLPIQRVDTATGGLTLGSGEFQLIVPIAADGTYRDKKSVFLSKNNEVVAPGSLALKAGQVALLKLDGEGKPRLVGFEKDEVRASYWKEEHWSDDPLAPYIIKREGTRILTNGAGLARLIETAGGYMPVSIERISDERRLVFFSRRWQKADSRLTPGRETLGRVLGLLAPGRALLRCGSGLVVVPTRNILSGLPDSRERAVLEGLRVARIPVWFRVQDSGEIRGGLIEERSEEIRVSAVLVTEFAKEQVSERSEGAHAVSARPQPSSVLWCSNDSGAFYYMESSHATWAELCASDLERALLGQEPWEAIARIDHTRGDSPPLSIVAATEAKRELEGLSVGREMSVRIVHRMADPQPGVRRYLVASELSGVLLEGLDKSPWRKLKPGTDLIVEVEQRNIAYQGLVTVVPLGQREYRLDLPERLSNSLESGRAVRNAFQAYLKVRQSMSKGEGETSVEVAEATEDEVAICTAYAIVESGDRRDLPNHLPTLLRWAKRQIRVAVRNAFQAYLKVRQSMSKGEGETSVEVAEATEDEVAICTAYAAIVESGDRRDLPNHLPTLLRWAKRQIRVADFELPYALMTIAVLFEAGACSTNDMENMLGKPRFEVRDFQRHWSWLAAALARLVSNRALRSLHVEALATQWLDVPDNRARRHPPIWIRLNELCSRIRRPLSADSLKAVAGFTLAADQTGHSEIESVSAALKASAGMPTDPSRLRTASPLVTELIRFRDTIPVTRSRDEPGLRRSQVARLRAVLDKLTTRPCDLQLLSHLPFDGERETE